MAVNEKWRDVALNERLRGAWPLVRGGKRCGR